VAEALAQAQNAPTLGPGKPLVLPPEVLAELGDLAVALQPVLSSLAQKRAIKTTRGREERERERERENI